jgi:hypothetical protein
LDETSARRNASTNTGEQNTFLFFAEYYQDDQINENEMGRICSTHKDRLGDPGTDGKIKWIQKE